MRGAKRIPICIATVTAVCGLGHGQSLPSHVRAVRVDAPPGGDGLAWATAYRDLDTAIAAAHASSGAVRELWLSQGTYAPAGASSCIGFSTNGLSLYGGFLGHELSVNARVAGARSVLSGTGMQPPHIPDPCGIVLTMSGDGLVCDALEIRTGTWPQGFRLIGGGVVRDTVIHATPYFGDMIIVSAMSPVLFDRCTITGSAYWGTPIELTGPITLRESLIQSAGQHTGMGMTLDGTVLDRSTVRGTGDYSPGIRMNNVSAAFSRIEGTNSNTTGVEIISSTLDSCAIVGRGYAGWVVRLDQAVLRNCDVQSGAYGALMRADSSTLVGCVVSTAMYSESTAVTLVNSHAINTLFTRIHALRTMSLQNGTRLTNCIIWGNDAVTEENVLGSQPLTGLINNSCVQGWTGVHGGNGNTGSDPLLNLNDRLSEGSPCIDAGDSNAIDGLLYDLAGSCRVEDGNNDGLSIVDIGPYEFGACYVNCDCSTAPPVLNVADFTCFLERFAAADPRANCDGSTTSPFLNVADFTCFLQRFAIGCP